MRNITSIVIAVFLVMSCNPKKQEPAKKVRLVTLNPGHFHAALVQKTMYPGVDSVVDVYAPAGNDLQYHLDRIKGYNTRTDHPTHWKEEVYTGPDFFERMIAEKKARLTDAVGQGNVVVLAGNNQQKTEYILQSLQNGFHVLADKPMVIDTKGFAQLQQAFETAEKNKLLLYDIMTERYEITTMLQRELSMIPELFGELQKGSLDNPAITKESVHHFYKYVSGNVLIRPAWFLDVSQQGEGIVDVMTHLVDLVQWECFPEQAIDYTKDIQVNTAKRWNTRMSLSEFNAITRLDQIPPYLQKNVVSDTLLAISCNGEINYTIRGVHAKTSVVWNYKAPAGTGDTHYSIMRGTRANLVIRQGAAEQYKPALYIEPAVTDAGYETLLTEKIKMLQAKYPGIELSKTANGWQLIIPEKLREGHEAHFARVMEKFLEYLEKGNLPAWEIPNMIAKYYTTTKGLEMALKP